MMSAMKFRHELSYDASPDQVFAMLADPAFREAVCAAQDVISAEVDLRAPADGFTLTIDQLQRTDDLPSFARTFAGDSTRAIQREEWADTHRRHAADRGAGQAVGDRGHDHAAPRGQRHGRDRRARAQGSRCR